MATLVFTALGTVLGGPIGGAIGALAGQALDAQIFKPQGRTGPRLKDLDVQTSRYGAQVPRIFGRMRVAGSVIWSTDLIESSSTSGGGKGQPDLTSYNYSASFAVALSARRIAGIGRVWADGNLLRGAAGDFKSPVGAFRVHAGAAGQAVDPLIAAAVGASEAPAFRGLAYAVLEGMQLGDFGNRIPSLTFEVIAEAGPVPVTAIAADLLGRPVDYLGTGEPEVQGYAAEGRDIDDALAPLLDAHGLRWRFGGSAVALVERADTERVLASARELHAVDGRAEPRGDMQLIPLEQVPARLSLRHFDPDRDYQLGVQAAERPGPGRRAEEIGVPAVIGAGEARRIADRSLRARLAGRRTLTRTGGWPLLDLAIGDVVALDDRPGGWTVERLEWEEMAPRLSLRATSLGTAPMPMAGDSGQALLPSDLPHGPTSLALVELASPDDQLVQAPLVFAAATGEESGWRRAALFRYHPETEAAEPAGRTAPRAILGVAMTALAPGRAWTFDAVSAVEIVLDHPGDALTDASDDELVRGANLCALGPELLQFGRAEPIAPGSYRLSRLVRGRHGTEWALADHEIGERFVLIDPARLARVVLTAADAGRVLTMRAIGVGDPIAAEAGLAVEGRAMLPPSPVHAVMRENAGDLDLGWTRRSRLGWLWRDLADAPLAEEREAYLVSVTADGALLRAVEVAAPLWTYRAADRSDDIAAAGAAPIRIEIRQIGTFGPGRPLVLDLS